MKQYCDSDSESYIAEVATLLHQSSMVPYSDTGENESIKLKGQYIAQLLVMLPWIFFSFFFLLNAVNCQDHKKQKQIGSSLPKFTGELFDESRNVITVMMMPVALVLHYLAHGYRPRSTFKHSHMTTTFSMSCSGNRQTM